MRKNVYVRAREITREIAPLVQTIRAQDAKLADQLKRAAQSVVLNIAEGRGNDAGNARLRFATACGSAKEVRAALQEPLEAIVDAVKQLLERTPPELASDIAERGMQLAGGGSLLRGFDDRLWRETGMSAYVVESPLTCVAEGAGQSLEEFERLARSSTRQAHSQSRWGRRRNTVRRR